MAQYPPPSSYFSGINYNFSFYSESLYILKSGDVMTGPFTAPIINAKTSIISPSIIYNGTELLSITNLTNYYNKTTSDARYLQLTGGTLTGILNGTTINATNFQEGGTSLTGKYLQLTGGTLTGTLNGTTINATNFQEGGTSLTGKYLQLTGGTITGDLTFNKANLNIQFTQTNGNNIGIPNANGVFSSSAVANDMVIRSLNNLMLQSGSGNSAIYIKTNNDVGIGTSNPQGILDIGGTNPAALYTYLNGLRISGRDPNTLWQNSGNLGFSANVGSNILFNIGNGLERMRISSNGNVGIGTNNPNYKLQVRGSSPSILRVETDTNGVGLVSGIEFGIPDFQSAGSAKILSTTIAGNVADLNFYTSSTTNNSTIKMSILGNGNVGINSSSPNYKLEIAGTTPALAIKASSQSDTATLYFATPATTTSAYKCALIAEGLNSFSRNKFHIALNNTNDNTYPTYNAGLADVSFTLDYHGNMGLMNQNPITDAGQRFFLNIANSAIAYNDGVLVIHKNNGGGSRHFRIGNRADFAWCIGDFGENNVGGSWIQQFYCFYTAPVSSLYINGSGVVYTQFGAITSSDIKIKTDIKTIDDALWKVKQLRGVHYTHIIEKTKHIGLIAQEVEGIIPEVVSYDETNDIKGIAYQNLVALLINAIKEQQEIIENQGNQIKNIMDILSRNNLI